MRRSWVLSHLVLVFLLGLSVPTFCFAGKDPLKKLAHELAELVVQYEQVVQAPYAEGGPQRSSNLPVITNHALELELRNEIYEKLAQIEPLITEKSEKRAYETIRSNLQALSRTKEGKKSLAFITIFVAEAFIAISPYAPLHWTIKLGLLGKSLYMGLKANVYADHAKNDSNIRKELTAELQAKNQKVFYEAFRKALLKAGAQASLPTWKQLGEMREKPCEAILLQALNIRLLPPARPETKPDSESQAKTINDYAYSKNGIL